MKIGKRIIALLLSVVLVLTMLPMQTQAAGKVKLNKTKVTAYIGSTTTLKVYGTKKKVIWYSSNKKIAAVSSKGKVIPKKTGKATITAKVSGKKYRCKVTVKKPYINASKKTLYVGKTYTLKLTGTKLKYAYSGNKSVASVSSKGRVTAKRAGTAVITCKGTDKRSYKCKITVQARHVHKYVGKVTRKATCQISGAMKYTCSCGKSYTKYTKKTGHVYTKTVFSTPNCCESGWTRYQCRYCSYGFEKEANPLGHDYAVKKVKPTCETSGYSVYSCRRCGDSYKTDYVNPLVHSYVETIQKQPNCYESGRVSYRCKYCGHTYEKELYPEHKWKETYIAPTCTSTGGTYVECTECKQGYFSGEIEEELPHAYKETIVVPSCEAQGYTLYTCKDCGDSYKDYYVEPTDHSYQRKVTKEPTCELEGESWEVCENCGVKKWGTDEEIPALGHAYEGRADGNGRMIACKHCAEELIRVSTEIDEKYGTMVTADGNGIQMMPGMGLTIKIEDRTGGHYSGEWLSLELKDGIYRESEDGVFSYYDNEQASIFRDKKKLTARDNGTTQLLLRYEGSLIDAIDIDVSGYSLVEAVRRELAGETNATAGYTEEYVQMVQIASSVIRDNITDDMTDYQKVKIICDWIETNVEYGDIGTRERGQRASEAITKKMAVCGGYTEAFYFFMEVLDIPCYYITGIAIADAHAWNMVQVDTGNGKGLQWYYIDTTWGDREFGKTVEEINAENGTIGVWGAHVSTQGGYVLENSYYFGEGGRTKAEESFLP